MNNFREGLNALREISDPEKAKLILEKITGKKIADYEGIDALVASLMGYYNDEVKKKQNTTDNTLETTAKEIVPAINEINSLAKKDKGERLPIGTIVPFVTDTIPLGYLLCDGREITQQDYPELYDLLPFGGHINEEVFRSLAKNEVPIMTSNTQDNFVITTSSEYNVYKGYMAFDNKNTIENCWLTEIGIKDGWLKIMYPQERAISKFSLTTTILGSYISCKIKSIKFYGITSTGTEEQLINETFDVPMTQNESKNFEIPFKTKKYKGFKIQVTNDQSDNCSGIGELKLFTVDTSQFPNANQETNKKYLPDLRNMFLRGNKQGRQLLTWQNDDNKKHNHRLGASRDYAALYPQYFYDFQSDTSAVYIGALDDVLGDNGTVETNSWYTYRGTEARPQNISVNYIIKAKNVSSEDTISPVIDEVNNKIETNRKGLADLKTEYNNHLRGLNETKVLYSQDKYISQSQTLTLTETIKNFKQIEITVMYSTDQFKSTKIHDVRDLTFNDSISATSNVKDVYINTAYGDIYSKLVFRTNGLNIATFTSNAYISKITGIGRIGGF